MFEKIRKLAVEWRAGLDALESDLEAKRQRLSFLEEAPLPWNEIAENIISVMTRHGETEFNRHFDSKVSHAVNNPLDDQDNTSWRPGLFTKVTKPGDVEPWALFALLREPLADAIRERFKGLDPLPNTGPPRVERGAEIADLERDIARLGKKIEAERQAAKSAGIDVAQIHNRPSLKEQSGKREA